MKIGCENYTEICEVFLVKFEESCFQENCVGI